MLKNKPKKKKKAVKKRNSTVNLDWDNSGTHFDGRFKEGENWTYTWIEIKPSNNTGAVLWSKPSYT